MSEAIHLLSQNFDRKIMYKHYRNINTYTSDKLYKMYFFTIILNQIQFRTQRS